MLYGEFGETDSEAMRPVNVPIINDQGGIIADCRVYAQTYKQARARQVMMNGRFNQTQIREGYVNPAWNLAYVRESDPKAVAF